MISPYRDNVARKTTELKSFIDGLDIAHGTRVLAVRMVLDQNVDVGTVARSFGVCERSVRNWAAAFEEGIGGLEHDEGAGRPPDVPLYGIRHCCKGLCGRGRLVVKMLLSNIRRKFGRQYSEGHARRMLARLGYPVQAGKDEIRPCQHDRGMQGVAEGEHSAHFTPEKTRPRNSVRR